MKKKIYLSILLVLCLIFGRSSTAYCDTVVREGFRDFYDTARWFSDLSSVTQDAIESYVSKLFDNAGFMIDKTGVTLQKIRDALKKVPNSGIDDNSTIDDIYNYINQNISVSDNSINTSSDIRAFINTYEDDYKSSVGMYYGHDNRLSDQLSVILNGNFYNAVRDYINQYPNDLVCVMWNNNYGSCYISRYDIDGNFCFVQGTLDWWAGADYYTGVMYDNVSWQPCASTALIECLKWDNTNNEWSNDLNGFDVTVWKYYYSSGHNYYTFPANPSAQNWCVSTSHEKTYKVYTDVATMKAYSEGISPYYYNNDVWQDYSTSSGDYIWTPTNVNTVTYGDVNTYIQDSYNDNGNYPTTDTTNNWIENTNTENITGGGNGGNGENGGSSGSGDGIFDFLSDLGGVLGNLIKNLGQAITNIIAGIADLVESIVTDLPTVFFDFIGALFGWLPEEWVTLLSLSLACMLIWGIVKVIRG